MVTDNYTEEVAQLNSKFSKEFEIKVPGTLRYFLGIQIARSDKGIFISKRLYII